MVKMQGRLYSAVTSVRVKSRKYKSDPHNRRYYTKQECGESMYYAVIKGVCK